MTEDYKDYKLKGTLHATFSPILMEFRNLERNPDGHGYQLAYERINNVISYINTVDYTTCITNA